MKKHDKKLLLRILLISLALSAVCISVNKSYGVIGAIVGVAGLGIIFVYALQVLIVAFRIIRTRNNFRINSIKYRSRYSSYRNKKYIL